MTVDTKLAIDGEDQRAKLSSWVKIKVTQSRPPVSKAMRTFLKQLSNDVNPEDIPEGRLLSALERETLIRAQKLQVVSDIEPLSLPRGSPASACSLLAEWTEQERIPTHELAVRRHGAVNAQAGEKDVEKDALACHLGFCMDMNGKDFPPMSGLWDDEKWVDVDPEEDEDEDELKVSFMDDDDDWVLAVMLELEKSSPPTDEEEESKKLDFRRAVLDGPPAMPFSGVTEDSEVAEEETVSPSQEEESIPAGNVLLRSELATEEDVGRRDIGAWKKSRSVAEARRILQQTEKRVKQGKKGKGKNKK